MCVKVGATVRATDQTYTETVTEVVNVYGPTVTTDHGNVYFYGEYEVVDNDAAVKQTA